MEVNKTYNESNLDTMSRMPDDFVDLVVTSPPYDNLRDYRGAVSFDFTATAKALFRVLKKGGIVVWVVGDQCKDGNKTLTSFKQGLEFQSVGFKMYDVMIFQKRNPIPSSNRYYNAFEYMFVLSKSKPKTINFLTEKSVHVGEIRKLGRAFRKKDGSFRRAKNNLIAKETKIKSNIWSYLIGGGHVAPSSSPAFEHPAIFPEALALDHILSWSNRNDLVYDPFMGSGTTALMCEKAKRNWIGSEISAKYCEIIERRLSRTTFLDLPRTIRVTIQ